MRRLYADEFRPIVELVSPQHPQAMPTVPVIDAHSHFGPLLLGDHYEEKFDTKQKCALLREMGIEKIFCLELLWGEEYDRLCRKLDESEGMIVPVGSVDVFRALEKDYGKYIDATLKDLKKKGSVALKLWKNMTLMGAEHFGKNLRLDDPAFEPIWQGCADNDLPIIIHVADPPCFFRPTEPDNEHYICLSQHPEWSFYREGLFSFEEHMEMQEAVIANHPDTTFVVAHVGSYAENLGQVAKWMDKYPNMCIDIAARLDQLGRQPYSTHDFITKYQDRVIFGTDYEGHFDDERTRDFYHIHYRFLQTKDEYFQHPFPDMLGQWRIYGLGLDEEVLKKVYSENAKRIFKL